MGRCSGVVSRTRHTSDPSLPASASISSPASTLMAAGVILWLHPPPPHFCTVASAVWKSVLRQKPLCSFTYHSLLTSEWAPRLLSHSVGQEPLPPYSFCCLNAPGLASRSPSGWRLAFWLSFFWFLFTFHLVFLWSSPRVSRFSKEPWCLQGRKPVSNQGVHVCPACRQLRPFRDRTQTCVCAHTSRCQHLFCV